MLPVVKKHLLMRKDIDKSWLSKVSSFRSFRNPKDKRFRRANVFSDFRI